MKTRKICPLATRIKKMMQTDDDVGKISQATPILIGRAMELFLEKLCRQAISVAQSRQAKTLTPSHLKAAVKADATLDFLAELVAPAPDLPAPEPENGEAVAKPTKRRRTNDSSDGLISPEGGRGRGRGGGSGGATSSGQANEDTSPGPPSRGRGSKPPVPPGGQGAPPSRGGGGSGQKKDTTGRRGPKGKAAAAAASAAATAEAPDVGPSDAAELMGSAQPPEASSPPPPLSPVWQALPNEAPAPGINSSATTMRHEPAVKHEPAAATKHEPAAATKHEPTAASGGGGGSSSCAPGASIVASLRAQQPFFGLGRKGKNLGSKSIPTASGPASAGPANAGQQQQPHRPQQQQQSSPQQPAAVEAASACAASAGCPPPWTDTGGRVSQSLRTYPLKLEPLDVSTTSKGSTPGAAHDVIPTRHSGVVGMVGAELSACAGGPKARECGLVAGPGGAVSSFGRDSPGAGAVVAGGEDAIMGQLSVVGSCAAQSAVAPSGLAVCGVAHAGLVGPGVGSLMAPLGTSIAYFQAPQQQGDLDDDYDDY